MLIVRPMQHNDLVDCARLMAENELWQRYHVTQESALERLKGGLEQQANILVADLDGRALGFVWYAPRGAFQHSGYILLIGIDPESQSQGIGAVLLSSAEEHMRASAKDVFLLVSDFNTRGQSFYQRHGYQQVGAIPNYILPGVSELIFHKLLNRD